jgi:hypothetical protein
VDRSTVCSSSPLFPDYPALRCPALRALIHTPASQPKEGKTAVSTGTWGISSAKGKREMDERWQDEKQTDKIYLIL